MQGRPCIYCKLYQIRCRDIAHELVLRKRTPAKARYGAVETPAIADIRRIVVAQPVSGQTAAFRVSGHTEESFIVADADGVVLVTPEYNHTLTPVQLNAIDWIGKEWEDKKVGLVGYGWTSGASQAHATARESLAVNLKAKVGDDQTNLFFMKHINPDGTVIESEEVAQKIAATVAEQLA